LEKQRIFAEFIQKNDITVDDIVTVVPELSPNKRLAKEKEDLRLYDEINELLASINLDAEKVSRLHCNLQAKERRRKKKEEETKTEEESDQESVKEREKEEA